MIAKPGAANPAVQAPFQPLIAFEDEAAIANPRLVVKFHALAIS
jgi:hypothetical protein